MTPHGDLSQSWTTCEFLSTLLALSPVTKDDLILRRNSRTIKLARVAHVLKDILKRLAKCRFRS